MPVRLLPPEDLPSLRHLVAKLLPDEPDYDFSEEVVFVWEESGELGGYASVSLRPWADGCQSEPCPYIEGWYVEENLRRRGVGRALMSAIEAWCISNGFSELGSDAETHNAVSIDAHHSLGFEPVLRLQIFRKRLGPAR